ncbi:magnesium transporter MRS2-4-like [Telopea speciosissima]|uniref:magnesium transporter MRS2-4-like n=1 Tax=Telopea speciosissima TaxID=54955 RepID=UPI001CC3F67C|nr:magnesium transporter MRS2-4-like [Telopea speciosissima]
MGKKLFFQKKSGGHHRQKKMKEVQFSLTSAKNGSRSTNCCNIDKEINPVDVASPLVNGGLSSKVKKKVGGVRLWMRFDHFGQSELLELDKSAIIQRVSIPPRDLRILGPVLSQSSNILTREKATVLNLDFIKAIVTAEEVLLPDPLNLEVIPFVDQLKQQLPYKSPIDIQDADGVAEGLQRELPFEFQVLEIALEVVCTHLDNSVTELERDAYTILDELTRNVSTKNLKYVRSLKSHLTCLLARVQKVRNEIEHILDDEEHLAHLHLTRKQKQHEALLGATGSNSIATFGPNVSRINSNMSASLITGNRSGDHDLEDLLEAYFMQLDRTRNHLLSVREYIDDTEDYVGIQLNNQRNDLIQLQLILSMASVAYSVDVLVIGFFSVNIPCPLYNVNGIFGQFVAGLLGMGFLIFFLLLGYARWKKLLG